ncbi:hypothetical protein FD04_GL000745 [Secundilactobacillus odoratitofui DSM 19909 = JCM 15043]|uniref:Uncharacterized protein n=1 Tax=Secundilactobacillus odoratitofui DSM 19909 = JCM 15043 TaxID=1423776 RepID=A0A0R1LPV6_9LACO|nr:hypothetical protein [Secundilactobacillus odoratitofui]KRK97775.1 hypothetical protein FD04_GL000745 [Secundilactobacillus odoratitofui DSM 19909 = JCM 15043]
MGQFNFDLNASRLDASGHYDFQNVFEFPDFIEMRPRLRDAVRTVAQEAFDQPVLPVKVERLTTSLEEQLERETRKYARQLGVYPNQKGERNELVRLFTHILQIISRTDDIDEELEDMIYAVNQTRLSLIGLPELTGEGELYNADQDQELIPGTFYYEVTKQLVKPYLINSKGEMVPENVTEEGRHLVVKMTTYAYRDWDAYLMHEYDEQHIIKNEKGLQDETYFNKLEEIELKYADHAYAEVLADTYQDFSKLLVPDFVPAFEIMSTDLRPLIAKQPGLRIRLTAKIADRFKLDADGFEHVMDQPLNEIKTKYNFYRQNFA